MTKALYDQGLYSMHLFDCVILIIHLFVFPHNVIVVSIHILLR